MGHEAKAEIGAVALVIHRLSTRVLPLCSISKKRYDVSRCQRQQKSASVLKDRQIKKQPNSLAQGLMSVLDVCLSEL